MNNKQKMGIKMIVFLLQFPLLFFASSLYSSETGSITGTITDTTSGKGTYWIWVSTQQMGEPIVDSMGQMILSSYTVTASQFEYILNNIPLFLPLYINVIKDVNPPYVEEALSNPAGNINPLVGDPYDTTEQPVVVESTATPIVINLSLRTHPTGKISGTVYYYGPIQQEQRMNVLVFNGFPQEGSQPIAGVEITSFVAASDNYYPTPFTINFLPDSTNYFVLGLMKLPNSETFSEVGVVGPVSVKNGQETTGVNFGHITGIISYSGNIPQESVLKLAVSKSPIRRGGDGIQPVASKEIPLSSGFYFPYFYSINFVPQGSFYVIAILDDNNPNTEDPFAQVGPMDTLGVGLGNINLTLVKPQQTPSVSTIAVNIVVTVKDSNTNSIISNATVKFFYTNNNNNPNDDIMITYGFTDTNGITQFSNQNVIVGHSYYVVVEKDGYLSNSCYTVFDSSSNGQIVDLGVIYLNPISINLSTNLTFEPQNRIISPDNDGSNDILKCKYTIVFDASDINQIYDISVSLAIDVDKDGIIEPVEWNKFFWDNQNRIFIKKNPDDYIDISNPDYSRLIGPISQDEYNRIIASYDVLIDKWSSKYDAIINTQNKLEYNGEIIFEGKDNAWNLLPNGTYPLFVKVSLYGYGLPTVVYQSSTTLTIDTAGIKGKVVDNNNQAVSGAKISCSGLNVYRTVFTDEQGNFVISGLNLNDKYHIEIDKEGFVKSVLNNISATKPENNIGTIQLQKGITISGSIILPNPPLAGSIKDQWGNFIYDLWINIEAQDLTGGPWLWKQVYVRLPETQMNSLSVAYSISVSPNRKYRIVAKTVGYVSKEVVIEVGTSDITQNIELTKAVRAIGYVKLPTNITEYNDLMQAVNYKGFGINIWARSKDGKYNSWSNIWYSDFELQQGGQKIFYVDSLVPNTSYYIGIEGSGFVKQQIEVFIGSDDTYINIPFILSVGTKINGRIFFGDGVYDLIKDKFKIDPYRGEGIWGWVGIFDESYRYVTDSMGQLFITSTTLLVDKKIDFTISGLENGKTYICRIGLENVESLEIQPRREFKFTVSTSTVLNIRILKPTGVVKGKLVNSTGTTIDFNKVMILGVVFGGGEPKPAQVDPQTGEFMFTGMNTGLGVLWGSIYGTEKDLPGPTNIFGIPSGDAQLFAQLFYAISGSTVDVGTIELKKPGTIEVILKGSPELINEIYQKENELITFLSSSTVHAKGPWGFVRVQPVFCKILSEKIISEGIEQHMRKEDVAIGLDTTISSQTVSDTEALLKYVFKGAEEGFCDVYFAVGDLPITRYEEKIDEDWVEKTIYAPVAVYPVKQTIYVKSGEVKQVVFYATEGVNVEGIISRPVAGSEEVISVYLKDKCSGKVIAFTNVEFTSDKKSLSSLSYKFEKVVPGTYLLVVLSPNYKVYSKEVSIPDGLTSVTLPRVILTKGANITGSLVDEKGRPVTSGVFIECFADPFIEGAYRNTNMVGNEISSDTGKFILKNLPKGTYTLRITNTASSYTNYATLVKSGILVPDIQGDVDIGVISLKPAVEISGSVKDTAGKPLSNVPIIVYPQDVQLRKGYEQFVETDKNGNFVFKGINKNIKYWELRVNVRPEDPSKAIPELMKYAEVVKSYINVTREKYRQNIDIILPIADVSIKGKVATSDNNPLYLPFKIGNIDTENFPAAVVVLQTEKDKMSQDPLAGTKLFTDPAGNFVIKGITRGKYTLKVLAKGYSMGVKELDITTSGETDVGTVILTKGYRLSGTITTVTGDKVSNKLVNKIVATTKNYSDMVIGQVNYNPVTYEVVDYYIDGLKPNVTYYIAMVPENADGPAAVTIDPVPVVLSADATKNLVYTKPKPHIELKSFKYKNINKDYLSICIKFVKEEINGWMLLHQITAKNYSLDDLPRHLFVALLLQDKNIALLAEKFDIFFIYGFVSHPVTANSVEEIVFTKLASGTFIPVSLSESKQQFVVCYIADGEDNTRGYFELNVDVANYYGMSTQVDYRIYLGEDARVEKVVTPVLGGGTTIGENDNSGIEIPSGTEFEGVDVSSPVNVVVKKLESSTVSAAKKLSPKMFSSKVPSTEYPGELLSSIYDVEVRLISGPLATLAKNNKVKLTIQISTTTVSPTETQLVKLAHYNDTTGKWEIENIPVEVDFENAVVRAEVAHLSKFAVFKVTVSTLQPYSGEFKTFVYPNPVKDTDKFNIRYCLPGSGKVKVEIKIYNIAGELVRSLETQEVDAGYIYDVKDIEVKNDKGENLASGVYFYYIKAGDYKKLVKFAIIR